MKLKDLFRRGRAWSLARTIWELTRSAWVGLLRPAGGRGRSLRRTGQRVRRQLRVLLWRQWKRPRTRFHELRKRGLDEACSATLAYNGSALVEFRGRPHESGRSRGLGGRRRSTRPPRPTRCLPHGMLLPWRTLPSDPFMSSDRKGSLPTVSTTPRNRYRTVSPGAAAASRGPGAEVEVGGPKGSIRKHEQADQYRAQSVGVGSGIVSGGRAARSHPAS